MVLDEEVKSVREVCERGETVVSCRVEVTDGFKMQLGLYHRCSESPSLFVIVLDKLAHEVRHGLQ